jgi:hypothetical protein
MAHAAPAFWFAAPAIAVAIVWLFYLAANWA